MRLAIVAALAACSAGERMDTIAPDAVTPGTDAALDTPPFVDHDGDGLDDAYELELARDYLPFLSLDPKDGCPLSGLVARVRVHPGDGTKISIVYSHLFERDCGINGHVGDNEAFGVVIDPELPAPAGILAIRTASHQNTPCERVTECTTCAGDPRKACDVAIEGGQAWPIVYASRGKHGHYASRAQCPVLGTCLDICTRNTERARPPVVNVGEPSAHLVNNLTTHGFITPANGWSEAALMDHDPWASRDFGTAGNVAGDLTDSTFTAAPCM